MTKVSGCPPIVLSLSDNAAEQFRRNFNRARASVETFERAVARRHYEQKRGCQYCGRHHR